MIDVCMYTTLGHTSLLTSLQESVVACSSISKVHKSPSGASPLPKPPLRLAVDDLEDFYQGSKLCGRLVAQGKAVH